MNNNPNAIDANANTQGALPESSRHSSTLVYVFQGDPPARFPCAVFSTKENAVKWIQKHSLSGLLTAYSLDNPAFDEAVLSGRIPKWMLPEVDDQEIKELKHQIRRELKLSGYEPPKGDKLWSETGRRWLNQIQAPPSNTRTKWKQLLERLDRRTAEVNALPKSVPAALIPQYVDGSMHAHFVNGAEGGHSSIASNELPNADL